jgi:inosose dehydratase
MGAMPDAASSPLSRRSLLAAALAPVPGRDRLAAQVYIWMQEMNKRGKPLAEGLDEIFASTRRAGFAQIELDSSFFSPQLRDRTLALLKANRMKCPVVYLGGVLHEEAAAEKVLAAARDLAPVVRPAGAWAINHNPSPKPRKAPKTDAELAVQARWLNRLGETLKGLGLRFQVHHHDPEMLENAREWRHILANTDAGVVELCVDTHWALRGGQSPLVIVREAGARLASLHVRNSTRGVWSESFGDGDIDYAPIAAELKASRRRPLIVVELAYEKETAITRGLEENLRQGRDYARRVFGV